MASGYQANGFILPCVRVRLCKEVGRNFPTCGEVMIAVQCSFMIPQLGALGLSEHKYMQCQAKGDPSRAIRREGQGRGQ